MPRFASSIVMVALLVGAAPAAAEPVENGTEIAQLLEALGDRCWAIDVDGDILDAAALSEVVGPIDIEVECVVKELANKKTAPLRADII